MGLPGCRSQVTRKSTFGDGNEHLQPFRSEWDDGGKKGIEAVNRESFSKFGDVLHRESLDRGDDGNGGDW